MKIPSGANQVEYQSRKRHRNVLPSQAATEVCTVYQDPQARCLQHCWLTDEEREQNQRCLVACWSDEGLAIPEAVYRSLTRVNPAGVNPAGVNPEVSSNSEPQEESSLRCRWATATTAEGQGAQFIDRGFEEG
jgi:hypothetical protein